MGTPIHIAPAVPADNDNEYDWCARLMASSEPWITLGRDLAECRAALYAVGRRATVDSALSGVIRTLGEEGELWLDTPTGPVAVRSGDLVVEEG